MRNFLYLLIAICLSSQVSAQSLWTGDVDTDWNNPGNWVGGVPAIGSTVTIPGTPQGGVFPVYAGNPVLDLTIQNGGTLTFNSLVYNNGTIINFTGSNIVSTETFINSGSMTFDNDGVFDNVGVFENYGTFDNAASATLNNHTGAIFNNFANLRSNGTIINDGEFNSFGTLRSTATFDNNGNLHVYSNAEFPNGSSFSNTVGALLKIENTGTFDINATFPNAGSIINDGAFLLSTTCILNHTGTLTNNANLETAGRINNDGSITNAGTVLINDLGRIINNGAFANSGSIELSICGILEQNNNTTIGGTINSDGIIYEIGGQVDVTGGEFGQEYSDLSQRKIPVAGCKAGVTKRLDASGTLTLVVTDIDKGSYGECGAQIVTRSISPTTFTSSDVGVQVVTLFLEDEFGFTSTCDAVITILPYLPPVSATDDIDIDFTCPDDITVTSLPGSLNAEASWTEPDATTTCTVSGGGNGTVDCSAVSESISGYTFIGEINDKKFFLSQNSSNWTTAQNSINNLNLGATFATLNSQAENDLIQAALSNSESTWIGFNDAATEGSYVWANGESSSYTNWNPGEPSGRNGENYARLRGDNGRWTDREDNFQYKHVLQIVCPPVQPDCNQLPSNISGFQLMGELNNNRYYVSNGTEDWTTAKSICEANGGQLVTISSIDENNFITNNINPSSGSVWTGLNTVATPGTFNWASGEPAVYFNWNPGEPNGSNINNAVRLRKDNGKWTDRSINDQFNYVMEIPCPLPGGGNCTPTGTITREIWTGISGYQVNDIPFAQAPNSTDELNIFEAPTNIGDNYGTRIRGYIFPPETGDYRFWIASDDNGELYLSTDDNPANKQLIANVPGWTTSRDWNKFSNQRSALITLQAGQRYYIEALAKEQAGGDNLAVGWRLPDGTNNRPISGAYLSAWDNGASCNGGGSGNNELTVQQIRGGANGGFFPEGVNTIFYEVTDACGNQEICSFDVTVETTPAIFGIDQCPSDITVNTDPGGTTAVVSWQEPIASSNCFRGQVANVEQTLGTENGTAFNIGTEQIAYAVFDSCGNFDQCSFNVTVVATPAGLNIENCPSDLTLPVDPSTNTAIASWTTPTGTSDCFRGSVNVVQIQGPQSGDALAIGQYPVTYLISDGCNNTEVCVFIISIEQACDPLGTPCDDNDPSTFDDVEDGNCNCAGTPCPSAGTACDDNDPSTFDDIEDGNCNCAGTPCPSAGTACDDNDPSTFDDVEDGSCGCAGTPCPSAGTSCDDGNPDTENDIEDGNCNCAGTPIVCPPAGTACDDNDPSTFDDIEDGNCGCAGTPCPSAGTSCDDNDPSTFDDVEDGNCGCAGTPCPSAGTICDDGNPDTENDIEDGNCNCVGTPINTGCTTTENLALNKPSEQSGTQQNGDASRANDGNTNGDFWAAQSVSLTNWVPNAYWEVDLGAVQNIETVKVWNRTDVQMEFLSNYYVLVSDIPFVSTDLNATLIQNGVTAYLQNDEAGRPTEVAVDRSGRYVRIQLVGTSFLALAEVEVIGCLGTPALPTCDDGIQNGDETGVDCGGANCPDCCPVAGTACDDGNPDTENDVEDGNCNCAGTPINNCPPTGTACDDGNPDTENDVEDGNCNCAGTPINMGSCPSTENLALAGIASQSGTQQGADASRANDGNTNGNFWVAQSVSLSNWVSQAWWEIDLGATQNIETINVWNRTDVQMEFLSNYYVLVSDVPFTSENLNDVLGQSGVEAYLQTEEAGTPTEIAVNRTGRYVRIQLSGVSFLALAEVEIIGCAGNPAVPTCDDGIQNGDETGIDCGGANCPDCCPVAGTACDDGNPDTENDVEDGNCNCAGTPINNCPPVGTTCDDGNPNTENDAEDGNCNCVGTPIEGGCSVAENLAINGISTQSGTQQGADASRANDGNTDGNFWASQSVSLSNWVPQAWWEIDLGEVYDIEDINVWNRTDVQMEFLSNYYVLVSDVPFTSENLNDAISQSGVDAYLQAEEAGTPTTVAVNRSGRYVRVQLAGTSFLALAEVEVMGCSQSGGGRNLQRDLLEFTATKSGNQVRLNWLSNTDHKDENLIVEKSTNGIFFEKLTELDPHTNSNDLVAYHLMDSDPKRGDNYYRLAQMRKDGKLVYSPVRRIYFKLDIKAFNLYPNPTVNEVFVNLSEFQGQNISIMLHNKLGQSIAKQDFRGLDQNLVRFDTKSLQPGVYTVSVKVEGLRRMTKKFVVVRL